MFVEIVSEKRAVDMNSSDNSSLLYGKHLNVDKVTTYSLYTITGTFAVVNSLIILITIFKTPALRNKNFYLLAGLAGGDLSRGFGYFLGGIRRLQVYVNLREDLTQFRFHCLLEFYQSFMLFGIQVATTMILVLSVDRFMAMTASTSYQVNNNKFAYWTVSFTYGFSFIVLIIGWSISLALPQGQIVLACITEETFLKEYFWVHMFLCLVPGLISIVLYTSTVIKLTMCSKHAVESAVRQAEMKRQAKITMSVATVMVTTFLFTTLPLSFNLIYVGFQYKGVAMLNNASRYMWVLSMVGAGANLFVYSLNYSKFKAALLKLGRLKNRIDVSKPTYKESKKAPKYKTTKL